MNTHRNRSVSNAETPTPLNAPVDPSTVPILNGLETVFKKLDEKFFNSALLINTVVTLSQKGTRAASGWSSDERVWEDGRTEKYYEINLCPEELNRPYEEIFGILLHEMVHLWCSLNEIKGCSSNAQYHNKKYRDVAEQHGLNAEKDSRYGYSITSLKTETLEFLHSLDIAKFNLFRRSYEPAPEIDSIFEDDAATMPQKSSTRKYVCPMCGTSIRATKKVNVRCDDCDVLFVVVS